MPWTVTYICSSYTGNEIIMIYHNSMSSFWGPPSTIKYEFLIISLLTIQIKIANIKWSNIFIIYILTWLQDSLSVFFAVYIGSFILYRSNSFCLPLVLLSFFIVCTDNYISNCRIGSYSNYLKKLYMLFLLIFCRLLYYKSLSREWLHIYALHDDVTLNF